MQHGGTSSWRSVVLHKAGLSPPFFAVVDVVRGWQIRRASHPLQRIDTDWRRGGNARVGGNGPCSEVNQDHQSVDLAHLNSPFDWAHRLTGDSGQPKTGSPSPILSGHFRRSSQPIALVEWHYGSLFLDPLRKPLGFVWGNASRCYQQQCENISRQLSVLEIDIVLAHLNSPVDTEQAHRLCGGSSDHDSRRFRRNVEHRRFGIACIAASMVDSALGNARLLPI